VLVVEAVALLRLELVEQEVVVMEVRQLPVLPQAELRILAEVEAVVVKTMVLIQPVEPAAQA
jgi:hypothetical protein